jgi:hypothetical protein
MRTAAVVSVVIFGFVSLQHAVTLIGYLDGPPAEQVALALASTGGLIISYYLPFCLGVFASLWLAAPVVAELSLASVVRRASLAAGIGALLLLLVRTVHFSSDAFSGVGSFVGNSFPTLPLDRVVQELGYSFTAALGTFLQLLPLVILLSVFVWMWLARHPSRHAVSVDTAEV